MDTETIVTRFILDEVLRGGARSLAPDDSLISSGILDSLALLKLLLFVEERFAIKVADGEVTPANFESVRRISAFVEEKRRLAIG